MVYENSLRTILTLDSMNLLMSEIKKLNFNNARAIIVIADKSANLREIIMNLNKKVFKKEFSCISHTKKFLACAFSAEKIGIDIEKMREFNSSSDFFLNEFEKNLIKRAQEKNLEFLFIWTLKEAIIKLCNLEFSDIARVGLDESGAFGVKNDKKINVSFNSVKCEINTQSVIISIANFR